ncbi:hypothetical protein TEA_014191 [Camellia sinensis var. sinensis]|uniref:Uncharacterized protein n=1 Tax=Camellia sinensis var. sinensis TaxID=542762 RepID=A0A4S4D1W8_CAMSN|nr:hypothetical protein TEA_014191 [Camellia sinensis var. sinensis]
MGRAPCCDKSNVKRGPWSPEEDAKLKAYIDKHGTGGNWIALPLKIGCNAYIFSDSINLTDMCWRKLIIHYTGLKRCGKSCRLRWLNYLRPNIKHGGFSEEEDNIICSLYISIGSRWSIIAAQLPGRTDNDIKNYWNTRLKKKLLGRRKQSNINRLSTSSQDPKDTNGQEDKSVLSNSALERIHLYMQLQSLQNPLSFYNNPALWPKLHTLQEKIIQSLQFLNENTTNPLMQHIDVPPPSSQPGQGQKVDFYEPPTVALNGSNVLESRLDGMEQFNAKIQPISTFQAELDALHLLNNETTGFPPQEDPISEFDCFKEMDGLKESVIWWSNDFNSKSASSNTWDATSVLQYQNYVSSYNLQ